MLKKYWQHDKQHPSSWAVGPCSQAVCIDPNNSPDGTALETNSIQDWRNK